MTKKELVQYCVEYFRKAIPNTDTELEYDDPFQLLVAVILSAQCTDKRVNMTTPALFAKYPDAKAMAAASYDELFELIRSISYPGNKTKHLMGTAKLLVEKHKGQVPDKWEELVELPGVGRKTANVVVSVLHGAPTIAVDTHVFRVSQRIGLVKPSKTPLEVEKQLMKIIEPELRPDFHGWLILHGRYTCLARKPKCDACGLTEVCKFYREKVRPKQLAESKAKKVTTES